MRVLIVDDSKAMRSIVLRTLRQAGFGDHQFTEATNGAEALRAIHEVAPDLVLSDWNMPEMTGIELLEALKAEGSGVVFGFVTSESSDAMHSRAVTSGAAFLITKPFTPEVFQEKLGPILV